MSNALTDYYLQTMGMVRWIQRPVKSCRDAELSQLAQEVASCVRCPLYQSRTQTVFSRGSSKAKLMIIGEAPGFYEDKEGLPFVGKAGFLLNQMLRSIGMGQDEVYIANVLKCRPPDNRDPQKEEIIQCTSYLSQQITLIEPRLILALGRFAGQFLFNKPSPLNQLRKTIHTYNTVPFMVSYHPAYLLRNPADKKKAFEDLTRVKQFFMD